jgi:pyrroline-5-carboxylate reductase
MSNDRLDLTLQQPKSIIDGFVSEPSTNQIILNVTKEDFEKIAAIDHIELQAKLKDNNTVVKLTPNAAVIIKAGVTADLKAIVDVNGI